MLPPFNEKGLLPPGDYEVSIDQLRLSFLVTGPPNSKEPWDAAHRLKLVNNLEIVIKQLWSIGISEIYIDGSFVEHKAKPSDIDGYFVCNLQDYINRSLENRLNAIDPLRSWGWDGQHRTNRGELKLRRNYLIELIAYSPGTMLTPTLEVSQGFRQTRHGGSSKGIIKLLHPGT